MLSLLLSLLSNIGFLPETSKNKVGIFPPPCNRIECPSFDIIQQGNGYEIRRYNSSVWISTPRIQDISLVGATRTGFLQLFEYIQGKNKYEKQIEMTAPVITEVLPGDGPFCESTFTVSFYVPKVNQANPPPAEGLLIERLKSTYVAIRQFGGFVTDYNIAEEAAALQASLEGTAWSDAIERSRKHYGVTIYSVAQYNSPFEFSGRVNEIWMMFDFEDEFLPV
ncbi:Ubiquitin-specific protease 15, putative isoform 1 [Hibiscus syriacus]|uniref:Ubiquitin-specific protease 15, putative isoform 1 n=1 Tax=Hibiscus syriacus TaxID=106335 RepID=A0A6A3BDY6_HIBSY|nr:heme-binding protein 2-like [Hibiscus syriacus]KAE8712999.1 Ubiquitin-specific protease 15, putative isoform 1 [Hibiscus syriacus]